MDTQEAWERKSRVVCPHCKVELQKVQGLAEYHIIIGSHMRGCWSAKFGVGEFMGRVPDKIECRKGCGKLLWVKGMLDFTMVEDHPSECDRYDGSGIYRWKHVDTKVWSFSSVAPYVFRWDPGAPYFVHVYFSAYTRYFMLEFPARDQTLDGGFKDSFDERVAPTHEEAVAASRAFVQNLIDTNTPMEVYDKFKPVPERYMAIGRMGARRSLPEGGQTWSYVEAPAPVDPVQELFDQRVDAIVSMFDLPRQRAITQLKIMSTMGDGITEANIKQGFKELIEILNKKAAEVKEVVIPEQVEDKGDGVLSLFDN